ncbi:MAG: InlB B-repeat-containing protein [Clostridiales bacterium]|jgi:uncharacterized repeat protein (TIGR02543 family)|nr:InlB B-repeat-containing protein [Clostridiales bacterium]
MKQTAIKIMTLAICVMSALSAIGLASVRKVMAASATQRNKVVFSIYGAPDSGVTNGVKYSIRVLDIYSENSMEYQSFFITYPVYLTINYSDIEGTWDISKSSGNISTIIKDGTRSPADLKEDIEKIYFTLSEENVFPPEGSSIGIDVSGQKMSTYVDTDGYVHYYQFYDSSKQDDPDNPDSGYVNWLHAYNLAKKKTLVDPATQKVMRGYLATITSREEQLQIYNSIAKKSGWLGGTRMLLKTSQKKLQDIDPVSAGSNAISENISDYETSESSGNVWYWACGPEAWATDQGNTRYYFNKATHATTKDSTLGTSSANWQPVTYEYSAKGAISAAPLIFWSYPTYSSGDGRVHGVYMNFNNPFGIKHTGSPGTGVEPNSSGIEYVLQFAYADDLWNDYAYNTTNNIYGYFVEYGGYPGDPNLSDSSGNIGSLAVVEIVMPVYARYRSEMKDLSDNYLLIESEGWLASKDKILTGAPNAVYDAQPLDAPAGYTFSGYTFEGDETDSGRLISDPDGNVSGYFSQHKQTVTFLYKPNRYTVRFNLNGGGSALPESKPVYFEQPYGELAIAEREGYNFEGWFTEVEGGTEVTADTKVLDTGNQTLYAHWTARTGFKVTYDYNGGSGSPDELTNVSWNQDGLLPAPPPERDGYVFMWWNVSENGSKQGVIEADEYGDLAISSIDSHITLQAQWLEASEEIYTVIYRMNGADAPDFLPNAQVSAPDESVNMPSVSRLGYDFDGWKVVDNGIGDEGAVYPANGLVPYKNMAALSETTTSGAALITEGSPEDGISNDVYAKYVILMARWSEDTTPRSVVYMNNYVGADEPFAESTGVKLLSTGLVPCPDGDPERLDDFRPYVFIGWNTDPNALGMDAYSDSRYADLASAQGDASEDVLTLYAQWREDIPAYAINYDMNGSESVQTASRIVTLSQTDLLPEIDPQPPQGWVFRGWDVSYNGSKMNVARTDSLNSLAADPDIHSLMLRAQWMPKTGYSVEYDLNPGSDPTNLPELENLNWRSINLAPLYIPVRADNVFAGWNTQADGSGLNVEATDEFETLALSLNLDDSVTALTLYAQWAAADAYIVKYDTNGGESAWPNVTLASPSDTVPLTYKDSAPSRFGYTFAGWIVSENGKQVSEDDGVIDPLADSTFDDLAADEYVKYITLKAVWTREGEDYAVVYNLNYPAAPLPETRYFHWLSTRIVPNNVRRPGNYILKEWNTNQDGSGRVVVVDDTYASLAGDLATYEITLWAQWQEVTDAAISYTVVYNLDYSGYTNPPNKFVTLNESDLLPDGPFPTRGDGYEVTRWDVSVNGSKRNVQPEDTFREIANAGSRSVTLKAIWTPAEYTVEYDPHGGAGSFPAIGAGTPNKVYWWTSNLLPFGEPVREGYLFAGWKLSERDGDAVSDGQIAAKSHKYSDLALSDSVRKITLTARWKGKSGFIVKYNSNGGSKVPSRRVSWDTSDLSPFVRPVLAGYRVSGWQFSERGQSTVSGGALLTEGLTYESLAERESETSVTFKAIWSEYDGFEVKYDLNGAPGTLPNKTGVKWTDTGLLPEKAPIREDYLFTGWNVSANGRGVDVTAEKAYKDLAYGDIEPYYIVLQAQWTQAGTYYIRYDTGGADSAMIPDKTDVRWSHASLIPDAEPTRAGYVFRGWKLSGAPTDEPISRSAKLSDIFPSGAVKGVTLAAIWEIKGGYTVHYDLNGPGGQIADKTKVNWNDADLLPQYSAFPAYAGHDFTGWNVSRNGFGTNVKETDTYGKLVRDDAMSITLQAQWVPDGKYNVKYDVGEAEFGPYLRDRTVDTANEDNLLPDETEASRLKRPGYTLIGWSVVENGSKEGYVEQPDQYGELAENTGYRYIVLQAVWEPNIYEVYYDYNDTALTRSTEFTRAARPAAKRAYWWSEDLLTDPPERDGYIFMGWRLSKIENQPVAPKSSVSPSDAYSALVNKDDQKASVTLRAQWNTIDGAISKPWPDKISGDTSSAASPDNAGGNAESPEASDMGDAENGLSDGGSPRLRLDDHIAYIAGYTDGNVRPEAKLTREETAMIFYKLMDNRFERIEDEYTDMESARWSYSVVNGMAEHNVMTGYPDGSFRPAQPITRAELITVISRFLNSDSAAKGTPFSDISGHWAEQNIRLAYSAGIIAGYPDGSFRPDAPISRSEAVVLINVLLKRNVSDGQDLLPSMITWHDNMDQNTWYYLAFQEAGNAHDYIRKDDGLSEKWTRLQHAPAVGE